MFLGDDNVRLPPKEKAAAEIVRIQFHGGEASSLLLPTEQYCSHSSEPGRLRLQRRQCVFLTTLFPDAAGSQKPAQEAFEREAAARFGHVPNFPAPLLMPPSWVHELWRFAKTAYLDAPIPPLFKERIFCIASRFCEVRLLHHAALRFLVRARSGCR